MRRATAGAVTASLVASLVASLLAACTPTDRGPDADSAAAARGDSATDTVAAGEPATGRPVPGVPSPEACAGPLLVEAGRIGPVRVGERVAELAARCTVADTALTLGEGIAERAHVVRVGTSTVVALSTGTADTTVTRVISADTAARTAGGVGPGSDVGALRRAHGHVCTLRGEGRWAAIAERLPSVSFDIGSGAIRGDAPDDRRIRELWVLAPGDGVPCDPSTRR